MGEINSVMGSNSILVHKTISDILEEVSKIPDFSQKSSKLDFYIHLLEEETKKIDAFKRELPLCMHLLQDAVDVLKKEEVKLKEQKGKGPMMEEFISLKSGDSNSCSMDVRAKSSNDLSEEKKWMSSAQLWINNTPVPPEQSIKNQDSVFPLNSKNKEEESKGSERHFNLKKWGGGAFSPFKKPTGVLIKEQKGANNIPAQGLSFSVPVYSVDDDINMELKEAPKGDVVGPPQQKKQRRCWSPELHRIFVDALHQLGGEDMATPKQIREKMRVEGLTNDEVKSHLQKYRLHVRRLPRAPNRVMMDLQPWFARLDGRHHLHQDGGNNQNQNQINNQNENRMVGNSGSPQGHLQLHLGESSAKGGSGSKTQSTEILEEEDDKSETNHSSKGQFQKPDDDGRGN